MRHVGDAVAFVVADTVEHARDAIEAIAVEWTSLASVVGVANAVKKGAPQVWPDHAGNVLFDVSIGDKKAADAAFAGAHAIAEISIVNPRVVTNFMETRAAVCEYDARRDHLTLTVGSQGSHRLREILCKRVLKMPLEKMRVICPDVGGGFGTKLFPYREYALIAVASKKLRKTIKWTAERSDHFVGDAQGRDNVTTARMALAEDGKFLGMDVDLMGDMGAYLSTFGPYIPYGGAGMLPGLYDIKAFHCRVRTVFTNTLPVDAYRGAGRPEAAYVVERLVDAAARKLGMTPDAIRRKNFISPKAMPYRTATGKVYDSGDFAAHMKRAIEIAKWQEFPKRAKAAKKQGLVRGIGLATYVEVCGTMGEERADVRLDPNGDVTVLIGTQSTGQGHATAYAQIIADQFGIPPERVHLMQGDTDVVVTGLGTGGSSSIPSGGVSVERATRKLGAQLREIAVRGARNQRGRPRDQRRLDPYRRHRPLHLLRRPRKARRSLEADGQRKLQQRRRHLSERYPSRRSRDRSGDRQDPVGQLCHRRRFRRDVESALLAGQVHGGTMQGIGQALMEQAVYDAEDGQLVTGTFMDYALPRAADGTSIHLRDPQRPLRDKSSRGKGGGEAGAIGSCPAVVNAIVDGLWREYRIDHIDMPATPERVWMAIREAQRLHRM